MIVYVLITISTFTFHKFSTKYVHKYQCKPSYLLSSEHVGLDESTLEYIFETKYENHFLLFPGSCIDTTENEYVDKRNPPPNQTFF